MDKKLVILLAVIYPAIAIGVLVMSAYVSYQYLQTRKPQPLPAPIATPIALSSLQPENVQEKIAVATPFPLLPCDPPRYLQSLEEALKEPETVCILSLLGPEIREISPEIMQLRKMTLLNIANTRITELPPEIGLLPRLQVLKLENNELTELPDEIRDLPELLQIDLTGNPMSREYITKLRLQIPDVEIIAGQYDIPDQVQKR